MRHQEMQGTWKALRAGSAVHHGLGAAGSVPRVVTALALAGCVVLAPLAAKADTTNFPASADCRLNPVNPQGNETGDNNNYGITTTMLVGKTAFFANFCGIMRFDVSALAGEFASIDSATLTLTVDSVYINEVNKPNTFVLFTIRNVDADWIEGTMNGTTAAVGQNCGHYRKFNTTSWAGGDLLGKGVTASTAGTAVTNASLASIVDQVLIPNMSTVTNGQEVSFSISDPDDLAVLTSWANGDANAGFFINSLNTSRTRLAFATKEHATSSSHPKLEITYTPISADTEAPSIPANVTATALTSSDIAVTWNASTDNFAVAGYSILRDDAPIDTTTETNYLDSGLSPATTYAYKVQAFDAAGNTSAVSAVASAQTFPPDTQAPSVPSNLTATGLSATEVALSWDASTDNIAVTGYSILRDGVPLDTTASTSYTDTGLVPSTTYAYQLSAYDAAGNTSAVSAVASATTLEGFFPSDDCRLNPNEQPTVGGDNNNYGISTEMYVGKTIFFPNHCAILRFRSITNLAGRFSAITSADLTLTVSGKYGTGANTFALYTIRDVDADWVEGTKNGTTAGTGEACGGYRKYASDPWAAGDLLGGNASHPNTPGPAETNASLASVASEVYVPQVDAVTIGQTLTFTITNAFDLALLESWAHGGVNAGFYLNSLNTSATRLGFATKEHANPSWHPLLTVDYSPFVPRGTVFLFR